MEWADADPQPVHRLRAARSADCQLIVMATHGQRRLAAPNSQAMKTGAHSPVPVLVCHNALKFTPRPGNVVLRAKAEPDGMFFCVVNSGPELSPAELDSIFKPFWQAGEGDRRGAGLGLAICHSIIEAHGGRIWAEPEPGKRVRICFTLSLAGVSSSAGAARPGAPPPAAECPDTGQGGLP